MNLDSEQKEYLSGWVVYCVIRPSISTSLTHSSRIKATIGGHYRIDSAISLSWRCRAIASFHMTFFLWNKVQWWFLHSKNNTKYQREFKKYIKSVVIFKASHFICWMYVQFPTHGQPQHLWAFYNPTKLTQSQPNLDCMGCHCR